MLGERFLTESQPRRKNGAAAHRMIGVARANSMNEASGCPIQSLTGRSTNSPMVRTISGMAAAALIHIRRVKSASSGLGPPVGSIGSSAMPQIGQLPGASRTICGCIGQVH